MSRGPAMTAIAAASNAKAKVADPNLNPYGDASPGSGRARVRIAPTDLDPVLELVARRRPRAIWRRAR